jgi:hypothetical protein
VARSPAPDDDRGVSFPRTEGGGRSTSAVGRAVFAAAARSLDPALADAIEDERDWRSGYGHHARRLVEAELATTHDPTAAARAGLEALHDRFEFVRDGTRRPLRDAVAQPDGPPLRTVTVEGRADRGVAELEVPYRGELLRGDALHRQLDRWLEAGQVEPSFAEAIRQVIAEPGWLDLSDRTIAVLGAAAEMGPLRSLCRWRANVLAVDLPSPEVTRRIVDTARAGNATVHLPVSATAPAGLADDELATIAGADVLTETPALAAWLAAAEGPLTVGNYVYADGADNVRVAMAVDAVQAHLCTHRDDVSLAVLATPTDVYAVPEEVVEDARRRARDRRVPLHERLARTATRGRLYAPAYEDTITTPSGKRYGIADSLVVQQGPNYLLAKRLQRWRARLAREQGIRSSANVAPATATRSVTKNRILAAAYAGAHLFGVEVFAPDTSNTLMAALLVHDLRAGGSSAAPATVLDHPLDLFVRGAAHGGLWRVPWAPPSVLGIAAVTGMARRRGGGDR